MELKCSICNKDLGHITKGNISKGLKPLCTICYNPIVNKEFNYDPLLDNVIDWTSICNKLSTTPESQLGPLSLL